jgi:hypothetical protein
MLIGDAFHCLGRISCPCCSRSVPKLSHSILHVFDGCFQGTVLALQFVDLTLQVFAGVEELMKLISEWS